MGEASETVPRDWRYFSDALAWYSTGSDLTGAQTMAVVESMRLALADGRITPADLGIEADSMRTCPKCRCLVNSPCPTCGAPMTLVSESMAICTRETFHCFKPTRESGSRQ